MASSLTSSQQKAVRAAVKTEMATRGLTMAAAAILCSPPLTRNQVQLALDPFRSVPATLARLATMLGVPVPE